MALLNDISKRPFGVEIEFFFPTSNEIERVVNQAKMPLWDQPNEIPDTEDWILTTESSVKNSDGSVGFEINSPHLQGEEGLRQISGIVDMLNDYGAMINENCGLHVHFEIEYDFDLLHFQNLFKLQLNLEDSFDCLVDFNRRYDNPYCKSNLQPFYDCFEDEFGVDKDEVLWTEAGRIALVEKAYTLLDDSQLIRQFIWGSKYHKLNMAAVTKHGTVEIRHHHGSLNYLDIANWVALQMALVETAKNVVQYEPAKAFFIGPQKVFTTLLVNEKVIEYYLSQ
jgi:hypothetical protein